MIRACRAVSQNRFRLPSTAFERNQIKVFAVWLEPRSLLSLSETTAESHFPSVIAAPRSIRTPVEINDRRLELGRRKLIFRVRFSFLLRGHYGGEFVAELSEWSQLLTQAMFAIHALTRRPSRRGNDRVGWSLALASGISRKR